MLMVLAALQMIPGEQIDAARIDGPGRVSLFRYILFPYLRPTLVVAALFRLIDSIKAFPLIYVLTNGGPGNRNRGDQLLRLCRIIQLFLLGLRQRGREVDGRRRIAVELDHRPSRRRGRAMNSERVLVHGAAALLLAIVLFPALWMLQLSFRADGDIFDLSFVFTPTLDNYGSLWTGLFPGSFANSVVVSLAATALSLLFGVPAAYALSRCRFRAGRSIALWILATRMAPPVAFTIPFFLAYWLLGLIDSLVGLVAIYLTFNLALVVLLMRNSSKACRVHSKKPPGSTAAASGTGSV
jgi:ABC-type glycerol-3-phosphate transport system permease component